ncbi:MAG: anaerobic nitric oxide reductase flavorubredoxin, partial [Fibrobacter sp.]|nr:anaerobic nitric oxide reductase flavorubredoxin [Fibrobacter sp.]
MNVEIAKSVYWTGKIDWELRRFHGEEYIAQRGSSYNSYLIKDQKNVLIDTVWQPFSSEFVCNLSELIELNRIDF